jgi:hypothetical protein
MTQFYIGVKIVEAWPDNKETDGIEMAAIQAHEANRNYCQGIGDNSQPEWKDAPQWQKDSAIMGVRAILANPDTTPEQSHEGWLAQKVADGWVYGPVKDPVLKQHPCMVPYEELPAEQRMKDDIFGSTVRQSLINYPLVFEGYAVKYPDGYIMWISKELFEAAYLPMGLDPSKVTLEMVNEFMGEVHTSQFDEKTSITVAETISGFKQYEVSSCVDPKNFDLRIGQEIGQDRIKNTLWKCLGFVLQWGRFGLKRKQEG